MNSILPDLEGFELQDKMEKVNGHNCRVWYHEEQIGDKLNKYWYYEDIGNFKPVRFYMIGYNVVLLPSVDQGAVEAGLKSIEPYSLERFYRNVMEVYRRAVKKGW